MLRAGDHVLHRPSGEKWLLACDEVEGEVICCGWPETFAKASDCDLVKAATDEERLALLREVAGDASTRGRRAKRQIDPVAHDQAALDDEAFRIEQSINQLDKRSPGYIARLAAGLSRDKRASIARVETGMECCASGAAHSFKNVGPNGESQCEFCGSGQVEPEVERVAREIRAAWVEWATRQPNAKPSWLVPWDKCDEQTKDADRYLALRVLIPAIARNTHGAAT